MSSVFSLSTLVRTAGATIRRFPIEFGTAVVGTAVGLVLAQQSLALNAVDERSENALLIAVFGCALHLVLQLAISVAREYATIHRGTAAVLRVLALTASVAAAWTIDLSNEAAPVQMLSAFVGALALVAIAPFRRGAQTCWTFYRVLLQRVAVAQVFTGVSIVGVILALQASDMLLNMHAPYYMHVVVVFIGLFNTLLVLSGVPRAVDIADAPLHVPQPLQWLVHFVLIPLVGIYVVILTIHGFSVLVLNDFNGSVAGPALVFGVGSLVTWVLAWPLREHAQHRVVSFYIRWLGVALIPITIMLTTAITIRISTYGVTPERHAVVLLTLFMVITNIALLVVRRLDVRFLPAVMAALALLGSVGPLDSASLSHHYRGTAAPGERGTEQQKQTTDAQEIEVHPPMYEPLQVKGLLRSVDVNTGGTGVRDGQYSLSYDGVRDTLDLRGLPAFYRDSANATQLSQRRLVSRNGRYSVYPVSGLLITQADSLAWYDLKCIVIKHE